MVRAGFVHEGVARLLVHHLKYRGVVAAGRILARAMAGLVPAGVELVPVPRVGYRRLRYGVDPAVELAAALASISGCPVGQYLAAPWWGRARAGGAHGFAPRFRARGAPRRPVILVDDVVTTGTTLATAAVRLPGVVGAVTATASFRSARNGGPPRGGQKESLPR